MQTGKIKIYQLWLACSSFGFLSSGCFTEVSTALPIENISTETIVTTDIRGEVLVDSYLYHHTADLKNKVKIDEKTRFRAISGRVRQELILDDSLHIPQIEFLNAYRYTTTFANELNKAEEGTVFQISLTRPGAYGAPHSTVQIPTPPLIAFPDEFTSYSRVDSIDFQWLQAQMGDGIDLKIIAECTDKSDIFDLDSMPFDQNIEDLYSNFSPNYWGELANFGIEDVGSYSQTVQSLIDLSDGALDDYVGCFVTFTLARKKFGELDENFDSRSFIKAINKRQVTVFIDMAAVE